MNINNITDGFNLKQYNNQCWGLLNNNISISQCISTIKAYRKKTYILCYRKLTRLLLLYYITVSTERPFNSFDLNI